jgi:hypothetical protein
MFSPLVSLPRQDKKEKTDERMEKPIPREMILLIPCGNRTKAFRGLLQTTGYAGST